MDRIKVSIIHEIQILHKCWWPGPISIVKTSDDREKDTKVTISFKFMQSLKISRYQKIENWKLTDIFSELWNNSDLINKSIVKVNSDIILRKYNVINY